MQRTVNRKIPWQGLGKDIKDSMTLADALANADLNFNVVHKDICIAGTNEIIDGYQVNVREDNGKRLGVVGSGYSIVQNREAFGFLDELVENGMQFDMGGVTKNNKKVWIMGRMPNISVLKDNITPYIYFGNTFDGSGSVKVSLVMLRQVCSNGMCFIEPNAKRSWSIRHSGDISNKLANATTTLKLTGKYVDGFEESMDKLTQLALPSVDNFLDFVFPMPIGVASDRKIANVESVRNDFVGIYNNMEDIAPHKGTAYGAYLAITDMTSHSQPLRETATFAENRFMNLVAGADDEIRAQEFFHTLR